MAMFDSLLTTLGAAVPSVLLALVILLGGWLVAVIIRAIVRKFLGALRLNERIRSEAGGKLDLEGGIAVGAYYVVLVMALIAFFNALKLPLVSEPLQALVDKVLTYLPHLVAGGVLILVAWIIATILRKLTVKALASTQLDEKLAAQAGMRPLSDSLGNILYALVLLLFLPAVLGALKLDGLLGPVREMVNEILGMAPNIIAAAAFAVVGWFVAGCCATWSPGSPRRWAPTSSAKRQGSRGRWPCPNCSG